MASLRRPSLLDRTQSSPLGLNLSTKSMSSKPPSRPALFPLTPPASPRFSRSSTDLSRKSTDSADWSGLQGTSPGTPSPESPSQPRTAEGVLICTFDIEILKDQRGHDQTFGYGAWSDVLKGTCHVKRPAVGLFTPPQSPQSAPPVLVAVKRPARRDGKPILQNEAKVLSHLMEEPESEQYVVRFHGMILDSTSLVLAAVPLSLDEHIKKCAVQAQSAQSALSMSDPVLGGVGTWLSLANKLTTALAWLHQEALVVHGDIKPGNILLSSAGVVDDLDFPFQPVFADFSSSQLLNTEPTANTLSAVTREYTAPELLSSKVLSDPKSTATTASDVFSLAVTLLAAATGNTMVYSGSMFQRQAMAIQGWTVIQNVRNGPGGTRVPRNGVIQQTLEKAVLRDVTIRTDASTWRNLIQTVQTNQDTRFR